VQFKAYLHGNGGGRKKSPSFRRKKFNPTMSHRAIALFTGVTLLGGSGSGLRPVKSLALGGPGPLSLRRAFSSTNTALPYGVGMNQEDMMNKDMLIGVDNNDVMTENFSKRAGHEFSLDQPRGILHRAFSVFLFNERNELLITQRAPSKITFPTVWTNTCCSHPLTGFTPSEVDDVTRGDLPAANGTKNAAIRKLSHELGIHPSDVPHDDFRFLTRFHYWAGDTITYGESCDWGEHEIDYVLFIKCAGEGPQLNLNPEEVRSALKMFLLMLLARCIHSPCAAKTLHTRNFCRSLRPSLFHPRSLSLLCRKASAYGVLGFGL